METLLSINTSQKKISDKALELPESFAVPLLRSTSSFSVSTADQTIVSEGFRLHIELPVRPEVAKSLERSLIEHAEIWQQLS